MRLIGGIICGLLLLLFLFYLATIIDGPSVNFFDGLSEHGFAYMFTYYFGFYLGVHGPWIVFAILTYFLLKKRNKKEIIIRTSKKRT